MTDDIKKFVKRYVKMYLMDIKNTSGHQKVNHDEVNNTSWYQKVCRDVKNTSLRQKFVMMSKDTP